jgi:hypothetical protein
MLRPLSFAATLLLLAGCEEGTTDTRPREVTTTCAANPDDPGCKLVLAGRSRFEVTLESTECNARGNIVKIAEPASRTLTSNACYATAGTKWGPYGPHDAGTRIVLAVDAPLLSYANNPPSLRVETAGEQQWRVLFEDGYDQDFNDVILLIRAVP